MQISRFGVSCERELLTAFDAMIAAEGFANRSEALGHLMRQALLAAKAKGNAPVVGTVTLVYDHHRHELSERLIHLQHQHHSEVLSALHIHLDHDNCLEVVIVRGRAGAVQELADGLISTPGVKSGQLMISTSLDEV